MNSKLQPDREERRGQKCVLLLLSYRICYISPTGSLPPRPSSSVWPNVPYPRTGLKGRTDGLTDGLASKHMPSYQQKHRIKILKQCWKIFLSCRSKLSNCQGGINSCWIPKVENLKIFFKILLDFMKITKTNSRSIISIFDVD